MESIAVAILEPIDTETVAPQLSQAQVEWIRCKPWIERAISHGPGLETLTDVESNIENGHAIFWAGANEAVITRIDTFPVGKALVVVYADGDGEKAEMAGRWLPHLEEFARYYGCNFLSVEAQHDDAPLMDALGLRPAFTTWIKEIQEIVPLSCDEAEHARERNFGEGNYGKGNIPGQETAINSETSK